MWKVGGPVDKCPKHYLLILFYFLKIDTLLLDIFVDTNQFLDVNKDKIFRQ